MMSAPRNVFHTLVVHIPKLYCQSFIDSKSSGKMVGNQKKIAPKIIV